MTLTVGQYRSIINRYFREIDGWRMWYLNEGSSQNTSFPFPSLQCILVHRLPHVYAQLRYVSHHHQYNMLGV